MEAQHHLWRVRGANREPHAQGQDWRVTNVLAPFASTEIPMARDNDPGDCNDYPNDKRGFSSPLHTTAAIDDALHGGLGKTPAKDDRKFLEDAIASCETQDEVHSNVLSSPYLDAVIEAARKHLETLPKPKRWRAVCYSNPGNHRLNGDVADRRSDAVGQAASWLSEGFIHVSVEEVK